MHAIDESGARSLLLPVPGSPSPRAGPRGFVPHPGGTETQLEGHPPCHHPRETLNARKRAQVRPERSGRCSSPAGLCHLVVCSLFFGGGLLFVFPGCPAPGAAPAGHCRGEAAVLGRFLGGSQSTSRPHWVSTR